ncbi:HipA domain-containing protein (plasmid) [Campylobacter fetus]|uniref:HipA domain-containing protein n=1 Tax=Campylobacter fetus TaxID=196 RepID=A0A974MRC2_CAMFE|nr:HipA domain-containing protein [Campylobacter fetus]OCS32879.1 hypothetical protein AWR31_08030 [Campylobacter fetus subsp. venerealis]QMS59881.1 HipA domain-containing protein [Campylobacter fetus]
MQEIDFSECQINARTYGGANGSKIGIVYNGENYMLKFPPKPKQKTELSYANSCFSEDISCKILKTLDLNSQDTMLGKYNDKIAVACKDFRNKNELFADFASLKNTVIDSSTGGYDTDLEEILEIFDTQKQFKIETETMKEFFWDLFIADTMLGNFDRHNGNWGFLINEENNTHRIAPIFDCGSCLFAQADEHIMKEVLTNKNELDKRIYTFPNSAIKFQNVKINPYHFLTNTTNIDCIKSLQKIVKKVDMNAINNIIENTPYISNLHKDFLQTIIKERKEKILDVAHEKTISNKIKISNDKLKSLFIISKETMGKIKELKNEKNKSIDKDKEM